MHFLLKICLSLSEIAGIDAFSVLNVINEGIQILSGLGFEYSFNAVIHDSKIPNFCSLERSSSSGVSNLILARFSNT